MNAKGESVINIRYRRYFHKTYWRTRWYGISRPIKFAFQRAFRGYDDYTLWDYPSHFKERILPVLRYHRFHYTGTPVGIEAEEWKQVLTTMIDGFEEIDGDDILYDENEKYKKAMELFSKWMPALWD